MSDDTITRPEDPVAERARALHARALVADMTLPWGESGNPELKALALPRFRAAGVDLVSLTMGLDDHTLPQVTRQVARERAMVRKSGFLVLARTADDIRQAKRDGKLAVILHFQGTSMLEGELALVETFYELGVRHMLMAYNHRNMVGDGCHEPGDAGLSAYGYRLVAEMNRVGMMVDCSHTGHRTTMDVLEASTAPVIFSHANVRALHEHPRNIRDDQIEACARTGGVIGVNGVGAFLGGNDASAEALYRHIDYIAQKVGPRHVGISLDFLYDQAAVTVWARSRPEKYPPGGGGLFGDDLQMAPPERYPEITELMLRRGWSEPDILGVLGENWMRMADQIWK